MTSTRFCNIAIAAAGGFLAVVTLSAVSAIATQARVTMPSTFSVKTTKSSTFPNSVASTPARCQTSQLSVRQVSGDAGVGNRAIIYAFTNTSSSVCTLYGYPKFQPLNAKGQPIKEIQVIQSEITYFHQGKPRQVTLAPGAQASFQIAYNAVHEGQSCTQVSKVKIAPPNTDQFLTLAEQFTPCGAHGGSIKVTPVESGII